MNELEQLLALLGVNTYAEGAAAITVFNSFLTDAQTLTGKAKIGDVLAELSGRAGRAPFALAVEKATGKTGDEAIGLIHAALASHAALPEAKETIAKLEKSTQAHALDALFVLAKDAKKLTPAIEKNVRDALAAGDITLKGAESWLANLTPIAALQSAEPPAPPSTTPAGPVLTHNGKTWAEMKGQERADLKKSSPALYEQMRSAAGLG